MGTRSHESGVGADFVSEPEALDAASTTPAARTPRTRSASGNGSGIQNDRQLRTGSAVGRSTQRLLPEPPARRSAPRDLSCAVLQSINHHKVDRRRPGALSPQQPELDEVVKVPDGCPVRHAQMIRIVGSRRRRP